jgi:hypothetical protein
MIETRVLDYLVGGLALVVAIWFAVAWRRIGESSLLVFGLGVALKGVGYAIGGPTEFDPADSAPTGELVRLGILSLGSLFTICAYVAGRARSAWKWIAIGAATIALVVLALDLVVAPLGELNLIQLRVTAHTLFLVGNVGCALYAFSGYRQAARPGRILVPAAFLVWGISNYTWLLIDLGAPTSFGAWVTVQRVGALALLVAALIPGRIREEAPLAPT